jgi:hypothetical protein
MTDTPHLTKPPCPSWCHRHWPVGPGHQHVSVEVRYASGTVQLERFDLPDAEGPATIVVSPLGSGEPLIVAATDADTLVYAISALWADAKR